MKFLEGKKVLLGVTGSIAIYKSIDILRMLVKAGAEVKVVMTESAEKFISPLTFEAAGSKKVLTDKREDWTNENNHISLSQNYDLLAIAPATVNTINKLANGIADNLLLQIAIAFEKPKIIAPAANTAMYRNQITQSSLKFLNLLGYKIVYPITKELACKTTGEGALAETEDIFINIARELLKEDFWEDRIAIVTSGATIEKIDDVRYLSNFSSGKQGFSLAKALVLKGANVEFITSNNKKISFLNTTLFQNAKDLNKILRQKIKEAKKGVVKKPNFANNLSSPTIIKKKPYLFMVAAVSDYSVKFPQKGKLKKEVLGEKWNIELVKNPDIISSIPKEGIISIAFKAETDEEKAFQNAKKALFEKNVDAVCLNIVKGDTVFGSEKNKISFISASQSISTSLSNKLQVSFEILNFAKELDE
jgi:phosphopantothenoylcysteine decarboxylase/phosphopantothenate--cysteine ligase